MVSAFFGEELGEDIHLSLVPTLVDESLGDLLIVVWLGLWGHGGPPFVGTEL